MKKLASEYPHADISARNFPLDTNALKKMSGIKDGGERHLFATVLNNGEKVVIIASINLVRNLKSKIINLPFFG